MLLLSCSLLGSTAMVSTKPLWVDLVVVLDIFPTVLMKRTCDWVESFPELLMVKDTIIASVFLQQLV